MHITGYAAVLVVLLGICSRAEADEFRASYELALNVNGSNYSIRTAETIVDGEGIDQELGPFDVEMLPVVASNGAYDLKITVTKRVAPSGSEIPVSASRTFGGSLGGPLEFSADFGGVAAAGAIMINKLQR